jgi:twitching motility protein PilT
VARLGQEHRGLVLVTGATGAGKSTTLASIVDHINKTRKQHIVTIEDPIEMMHPDHGCIVNQREVGIDTESFGQALRRALRQDPDVILIGELRDAETAETAMQAAESGHLVLSTMHTVDAAETVGRMVEFFPTPKQPLIRSILAGVLKGVVSQRLLPKLDGGRIAAVEVMVTNDRIADLIRENKAGDIPAAIAEGAFYDMQTLSQALIDLVLKGFIDYDVAGNAAPNRHDFTIALDHAEKTRAAATAAPATTLRAEPPPDPSPADAPPADPPPPPVSPLRLIQAQGTRPPTGA